jgi:hypothetical protein
MKKLFNVASFIIVVVVLSSCSKEETTPSASLTPVKNAMTGSELAFIEALQRSIKSPNNQIDMRSSDVSNSANPYDYVGENNVNAMKYAIDIEKQRPHGENPDYERFSSNVHAYFDANPVAVNPELELSNEFQYALQTILKSTFLQGDRIETIADIKIIEKAIISTNMISEAQKAVQLNISASLRHMKDFAESYNIYLGDEVVALGLPTWEELYADCLNDALMNWEEHPVATTLAWADLPSTIASCAADATWVIATR